MECEKGFNGGVLPARDCRLRVWEIRPMSARVSGQWWEDTEAYTKDIKENVMHECL